MEEGIPTAWGYLQAGSYRSIPKDADFVINLTREIDSPCDMKVPIRDFSVPTETTMIRRALMTAIARLTQGQNVYVHCMGGTGRTGMFLALLARIEGYPNGVSRVRAMYRPTAVETEEQELYVKWLPIDDIKGWAKFI